MSFLTQRKAAKVAGVSQTAINKLTQRDPRPSYCFYHNGTIKIDDSNIEWLEYIKLQRNKEIRRQKKKQTELNKTEEKKEIPKQILANQRRKQKKAEKNNAGSDIEIAEKQKQKNIKKLADNEKEIFEKELDHNIDGIDISKMDPGMVLDYQELFKAQKLKEEALLKQLQRKRIEKSLIDADMANYLFISFIQQVRSELALVPGKIGPVLKTFFISKQDMKAEETLKKEFKSILERVIEAQKKALAEFKKSEHA